MMKTKTTLLFIAFMFLTSTAMGSIGGNTTYSYSFTSSETALVYDWEDNTKNQWEGTTSNLHISTTSINGTYAGNYSSTGSTTYRYLNGQKKPNTSEVWFRADDYSSAGNHWGLCSNKTIDSDGGNCAVEIRTGVDYQDGTNTKGIVINGGNAASQGAELLDSPTNNKWYKLKITDYNWTSNEIDWEIYNKTGSKLNSGNGLSMEQTKGYVTYETIHSDSSTGDTWLIDSERKQNYSVPIFDYVNTTEYNWSYKTSQTVEAFATDNDGIKNLSVYAERSNKTDTTVLQNWTKMELRYREQLGKNDGSRENQKCIGCEDDLNPPHPLFDLTGIDGASYEDNHSSVRIGAPLCYVGQRIDDLVVKGAGLDNQEYSVDISKIPQCSNKYDWVYTPVGSKGDVKNDQILYNCKQCNTSNYYRMAGDNSTTGSSTYYQGSGTNYNTSLGFDWMVNMSTNESYYDKRDAFKPDKVGYNYTLKTRAYDTTNSYNTSVTTQFIDNAAPIFDKVKAYEAYEKDYQNSYCGRNSATTFGGSETEYSVNLPTGDDNYTLFISRIKNTNTIDLDSNNIDVETLSSGVGSDCNGNNWVIEKIDLTQSQVYEGANYFQFNSSGGDNNYIDWIALRNNSESTKVFSNSSDVLIEVKTSDVEGSIDTLKRNDALSPIMDPFGSGNSALTYTTGTNSTNDIFKFEANDTTGLTSTKELNITTDTQKPSISTIKGTKSDILQFNETNITKTLRTNITDPHIKTRSCNEDKQGETLTHSVSDICSFKLNETDHGNNTIEFVGKDSVGHKETKTQNFKLTDINFSTSEASTVHNFEYGTNQSPENTKYQFTPSFALNYDMDVNGTANGLAKLNQKLETTGIKTNTIKVTKDGNSTGHTFNTSGKNKTYFNITANTTKQGTSYTEEGQIKWDAGTINAYWQNSNNDQSIRFYRLNTAFKYNYTLKETFKLEARSEWDTSQRHIEIWKCSKPSNTNRYSCDGTWNRQDPSNKENGEDTDNDGKMELAVWDYKFSDNLIRIEVNDDNTGSSGGGSDSDDQTSTGSNGGDVVKEINKEGQPYQLAVLEILLVGISIYYIGWRA